MKNKYVIVGRIAFVDVSTRTLPGTECVIDVSDIPLLSSPPYGRWHGKRGPCGNIYVRAAIIGRRGIHAMIHRVILGLPLGRNPPVDHRNHDTQDNRRDNIRVATNSLNNANRRKTINKTHSRFKGVTFHAQCGKWQAQIRQSGRNFYLGLFRSERDAANAYDAAAKRLFGRFAQTNHGATS